ncbi:6149_t:CDS:1, partial [Racocetra persica]
MKFYLVGLLVLIASLAVLVIGAPAPQTTKSPTSNQNTKSPKGKQNISPPKGKQNTKSQKSKQNTPPKSKQNTKSLKSNSNPDPPKSTNPPKSNNSTCFQKDNAIQAENLQKKFDTLTTSSPCNPGDNACINGQFAQCSGKNQWSLQKCNAGLTCCALPLRNKPGTSVAC